MGALRVSSRLYLGRFIWQTTSERSIEEEAGFLRSHGFISSVGSGAGRASQSRQSPRGVEGAGSQRGQPSALRGDGGRQSLSFTCEGRAGLSACDKGAGASKATREAVRGCHLAGGFHTAQEMSLGEGVHRGTRACGPRRKTG